MTLNVGYTHAKTVEKYCVGLCCNVVEDHPGLIKKTLGFAVHA